MSRDRIPLFLGGQGRSNQSIEHGGQFTLVLAIAAVLLAIVLACVGGA